MADRHESAEDLDWLVELVLGVFIDVDHESDMLREVTSAMKLHSSDDGVRERLKNLIDPDTVETQELVSKLNAQGCRVDARRCALAFRCGLTPEMVIPSTGGEKVCPPSSLSCWGDKHIATHPISPSLCNRSSRNCCASTTRSTASRRT